LDRFGTKKMSEKMTEMNAWPWPESLDALTAAPRHHKLVLDNERVRVLDTRIPPGEVVPVHTHRWPGVYYTIAGGDFVRYDAEGKVLFDSRTDLNTVRPAAQFIESLPPHSVENVGNSEIHLISVEMKY
jgi:quercetin dioxygenase-like cupin family protein